MTIKKRFLITYVGGVLIASFSLSTILAVMFYLTTGVVPTPNNFYRSITQSKMLTEAEQYAYLDLRAIAKTNPDSLLTSGSEVEETVAAFEENMISFAIKKDQNFIYFSEDLFEQSLRVHFPLFDSRNLDTKGTIDNNGNMYRYLKYDFYFSDQSPGTIMILKQENNLLDFMSKWGGWIIFVILSLSMSGLVLLNYFLNKSTIEPIRKLSEEMKDTARGRFAKIDNTQKSMSYEIEQLFQDFNTMQQELLVAQQEQQNLENNRKELIASISHDLKTPITSIIGYVEGLRDGVATNPEKNMRYLQTIHAKAIGLNEMIDTLFLYSKLEANAVTFNFEKVEIFAFANHLVEEYRLQEPMLEFNITTQTEKTLYVRADRMQLNRVFYNLIDNSIRYCGNKDNLKVELQIIDRGTSVDIKFCDNGEGIVPEELPHIFETFYRIDKARSSDLGGSGLGLSIVKQIITNHDGQVQIESTVGEGTTLTISLPQWKEN